MPLFIIPQTVNLSVFGTTPNGVICPCGDIISTLSPTETPRFCARTFPNTIPLYFLLSSPFKLPLIKYFFRFVTFSSVLISIPLKTLPVEVPPAEIITSV